MSSPRLSFILALLPAWAAALNPHGYKHVASGQLSGRDLIAGCTFAVTAGPSDSCATLAGAWGLNVAGLRALNPTLTTCPRLVAGQSYCVQGSAPTSTPPSPSPPTTTTPTTTTPAAPLQPTQSGLAANCDTFYLVKTGDTCDAIARKYSISLSDFYNWNPAVGTSCNNMWADYYVCVGTPGSTHTSPAPSPTPTGPQPQMPGITPGCKKFYQVKSGDTCFAIEQANGISLAQILAWNSNLNSGCTNLWLGYYICTAA
ncbi:LysM domain-containing protein [Lasiosphaeria ovina]|uniref:LysM domain-containing protein n=1 Tax=Lasiosphaeria ovina TaxID=92902 RepID=A0AAE0KEW6_9PEZI|nr:LysM domain-containing protein [Lasiosphaeria ovina]